MTRPLVSLDGCEPEIRARVEAMLIEANGRLWVRRGKSTYEEQLVYWQNWLQALQTYGKKEAHKYCEFAAYPGTSQHERKRAAAIDVMCDGGDEEYRDALAKKYGLYAPLEDEPWHLELYGNRPKKIPKPVVN
jgi:hypothetical protein